MFNRFIIDAQAGSVKIDEAIGASKTSEYGSMSGGSFELDVQSEAVKIYGEQIVTSSLVMNSTASMLYISNSFYPNSIDGTWSSLSSMPWYDTTSKAKNIQTFMSASNALGSYCSNLPNHNSVEERFPRLLEGLYDAVMMDNGKILYAGEKEYMIYDPNTSELTKANIYSADAGFGKYRMVKLETGEVYIDEQNKILYNPVNDSTLIVSPIGAYTSSLLSDSKQRVFSLGGGNMFRYLPAYKRTHTFYIGRSNSYEDPVLNFPILSSETWPDVIMLSDGVFFFGPRNGCPYGTLISNIGTPQQSIQTTSTISNNAPTGWRALAELDNGDIFISPGNDSLVALIWQRATDTWITTTAAARTCDMCFTIAPTKIFCIKNLQVAGQFAQIYDTSTSAWSQGPSDLLYNNKYFYLKLPDGRVILNSISISNDVYIPIYNPVSNTFQISNSASSLIKSAQAVTMNDGRVFAAPHSNYICILNVNDGSIQIVNKPSPNFTYSPGNPVLLKDGRVAFIDTDNSTYRRHLIIYNPEDSSFITTDIHDTIGSSLYSSDLFLTPDGRILMVKGSTVLSNALFLIFDPISNTFTQIINHTSSHNSACGGLVILDNGKVLFNMLIESANPIYDFSNGTITFTGASSVGSDHRLHLLNDGQVAALATGLNYIYSPTKNSWDTISITTATGNSASLVIGASIRLEDGNILCAGSSNFLAILNVNTMMLEHLTDYIAAGSRMIRLLDGRILIYAAESGGASSVSARASSWRIFSRKNINLPANWSLSPLFK